MQKIIHQIWVGPHRIPSRERGFIFKMIDLNPNIKHELWLDNDIPVLPENIKKIYDYHGSRQDYALQADLLRIYLVANYGGFYIDVDFDPSKPFGEDLFEKDLLLFHHDEMDHTIPNNVFGASKGNDIFASICEGMDIRKDTWYGPSGFGENIKKHFGLPYETPQSSVRAKVESLNGEFRSYYDFECKYARHMSLYSWCPENKNKFSRGDYA